jgi:4'-phosphopantetheinyl transferase
MNVDNALWDSLNFRAISIGQKFLPEHPLHTPEIESDIIHIWSAEFSDLDAYYENLFALTSRDEREKSYTFRKAEDARRFVIRHGILRLLLSYYTLCEPVLLPLVISEHGKPGMDTEGKFFELSFSLSHTAEVFIIGITKKLDIGIDIVKTNPRTPFSEIERYLFTPGERRWIERTILEQRSLQFFRIWSLKEALLKATGSDVTMTKEADVSGIITDTFLNGFYTIHLGKTDIRFFIHECSCDHGHHCTIAVNLGT